MSMKTKKDDRISAFFYAQHGKIGEDTTERMKFMDIEYNGQRRALIVRLDAEVDHHSAAQIRESVDAQFLRTKANHIIFDFSSLQFMDSSGIGLIMGRYRLIRPLDGKIVLAGVSEQLDRLMSLSGIYKLVEWAKNVEEALVRVQGGNGYEK